MFLTQYQWKTSNFYIMLKINKCEEIITIIEETSCACVVPLLDI